MHTYSGHLRSQGWHRTGGGSLMMWVGGIHCLPASDRVTHSDRSTPFATIPHDPVCPSLPSGRGQLIEGGTHRAVTGCVGGHTRSYADSSTPPILAQISLSKLTRALIIVPASFK